MKVLSVLMTNLMSGSTTEVELYSRVYYNIYHCEYHCFRVRENLYSLGKNKCEDTITRVSKDSAGQQKCKNIKVVKCVHLFSIWMIHC